MCSLATASWGQKDTIRPGVGSYDFLGVADTLGVNYSGDLIRRDIQSLGIKYMTHYIPTNSKQNAIYGIGIVASYGSRNSSWGAKLYRSISGSDSITYWDTLQCERMAPYTSTTPWSYFHIVGADASGNIMDTTVCIYDFYFDAPYYADSGESLYLSYYDSLCYHNATEPVTYTLFMDSTPTNSASLITESKASYNTNELYHFERQCDSLPYCIRVRSRSTSGVAGFSYSFGFFPITSPPTQQIDTVPACEAAVENLRFVRQGDRCTVVAWDTIGRASYNQVRWGRYTVDSLSGEVSLQDGRIVNTYGDTAVLNVADTGWFACRVRAVCEHQCYYHDETDYSDWSDTLYFYISPEAEDTTVIRQAAATLQARIAPNPTQGALTVTMEQEDNYTLTVYNDMGMRLLTDNFTGTRHGLNVSRLPRGHYILAIASKQATTCLAFVKQ